MKKRLIIWVLNKLKKTLGSEEFKNTEIERVKTLIFSLYEDSQNPFLLDKEISAIIFNAKYTSSLVSMGVLNITPYDMLSTFYSKANKGDNSFKKEPFYRTLLQTKDIEVRKLDYRLKRN